MNLKSGWGINIMLVDFKVEIVTIGIFKLMTYLLTNSVFQNLLVAFYSSLSLRFIILKTNNQVTFRTKFIQTHLLFLIIIT